MAQLEGEIRRREAARTAEVAALRSMLAAQQQQIMALQAQVHEQGGSAQGEAQGIGCMVDAVVLVPCEGHACCPAAAADHRHAGAAGRGTGRHRAVSL